MTGPLPLPTIPPEHDGVRLRAFTGRDVPMLQDLSHDPYVPLTGTLPAHADEAGALAYIARQHERRADGAGLSFCAALAGSDVAVGQAGLWLRHRAEGRAGAGYAIAPSHRGRGLAARALTALTGFAWSLEGLHRIELYIEPWNVASERTARAAGYEREALLPDHQEIGGRRVDMLLYTIRRPARSAPGAPPEPGVRPSSPTPP